MSVAHAVPSAQDRASYVRFTDAPPEDPQRSSENPPDPLSAIPTWQPCFDPLPASHGDVDFFVKEAMPRSACGVATLDQLAVELAEHVEAGRIGSHEGYTFDLEVPGFGRMEGRLTIRRGQADVELHALRADAAALLRARLPRLQRQVDRESAGDVNLFIV